jgi:MerR family redox-sensitive transcriptional activator SoxR
VAYRIGEVAQRAGIATSAIRYYEKEGLILEADRQGNARVYGADIFDRLAMIELAKKAGFTIAETRELVRGISRRTSPGPRLQAMARKKLLEVEERIAEAERMRGVLQKMMRCECQTFEECTRAGR